MGGCTSLGVRVRDIGLNVGSIYSGIGLLKPNFAGLGGLGGWLEVCPRGLNGSSN